MQAHQTKGVSGMHKLKQFLEKTLFVLASTCVMLLAISCGDSNPTGSSGGAVKDIDGNSYTAVTIGTQTWTVENLRTTKLNDGTPIALVTEDSEWNNNATAAYCWFNNEAGNKGKYGALYNWYAISSGKLAPQGWHIPTDAEWTTLVDFLIANGYNWDGSTSYNRAAKSMAAKTDWLASQEVGAVGNDLSKNNGSGFTGLPGSSRSNTGGFYFLGIGRNATWWTATQQTSSSAVYRELDYGEMNLIRNVYYNSCGFSVRLVKD